MTVSNSDTKPIFSTGSMTVTALMTAAICVIGPLSIPLAGGVPISLQDFIIGLAAVLLGMKRGTMATFLYLLLGLAGLPVFSGFTIGTAWLMWMAHMDLKAALFAGVIPFLPGNAVKTVAVVLIGRTVKPLLGKVLDQ